jgi:hypothetical protein
MTYGSAIEERAVAVKLRDETCSSALCLWCSRVGHEQARVGENRSQVVNLATLASIYTLAFRAPHYAYE